MNPSPASQARNDAGLTLKAAARRLGVTAAHLGRLERTGDMPFATARRICAVYGCRLDDLLPRRTTTRNGEPDPDRNRAVLPSGCRRPRAAPRPRERDDEGSAVS